MIKNELLVKHKQRRRRKLSLRRRIFGTAERPRMSVHRSLKNISVQLIDDINGRTLCSAGTRNKDMTGQVKYGGNCSAAATVGQLVAERARMQGIRKVAFDRSGYKFHGRIKALADAARKAGLEF